MEGGRILHFSAGSRHLALPLSGVKEVAEVHYLVSVPGAPAIVGGLTEIRGRVVTVLDPATGDGAPGTAPGAAQTPLFAVIFTEPFDHLGVLVRGVPETASAMEGAEPTVPSAGPEVSEWLSGSREIVLTGGCRATLLEPERLADHASRCVRAQFLVAP